MTDLRQQSEQASIEHELGDSVGLGLETGGKGRERRTLLGALHGMPPWVGAIIGIVVILVAWQIVSVTFYPKTQSIPQPALVGKQLFYDLFQTGVYWNAIAKTGGAALWGYLWGNLIALFLAFLVLVQPWFEGLSTQLAVVCSCIPLTAIAPIVTLLAPAGSRNTSIFLAALSVIFTTVVGTILGLRAASETQIDVIRAYGGGRMTQLFKVRLIAALPSILAALKLAAPAAFLGAVLGEYFVLGVDSGIGILLLAAQATGASVRLWAIALISAGVAGAAYFLIGRIGRLLTPWSAGDARAGEGF
ncbi:ABC transporter permease [Frondihabitans australicus]|uniref:ABC-type nitrate/sulfonate/bicarbonate transport system permease component n=1 Tax=Frondihabitans australicus TaxID=386892 RepID=A0A495IHY0_9MICO|nr:ABC transporter permease subunit [Frondihabitans australicus]RKR75028.1 ABC-type nitrate/sulfonate/bicarbonate transport system permease component [Frondihabitans australicus]